MTQVGAISKIRPAGKGDYQTRPSSRRLTGLQKKSAPGSSSKTGTVKSATHIQAASGTSFADHPDFTVSISQSARDRMEQSDVVDLVPTVAPDLTLLFVPLSY